MAIQGNLQDVNLASLIQMLCMDQRRAALNLRRSEAEEGLIYFEKGEIVHALTDSLTGEEAVYHLLGWAEGTFNVSDQAKVPDRTIVTPWNFLLMEGMRLLDEQKVSNSVQTQPEVALSPDEVAQDRALEDKLILLLSRFEQFQTPLADIKYGKQSETALQVLTEVANEVIAFTENLPEITDSAALSKVLADVAKNYSTLRLLHARDNRLSTEVISNLYTTWTGDVLERRHTFGEISQGMLAIIDKYFKYIVAQFQSNIIANQWQETCQIFLTELKQAINKIRF